LVFPAVAATCVLEAVETLLDYAIAASKAQVVCVPKVVVEVHPFVQLLLQHFVALAVTVFVELVHLTTTAE
jgi:hypothetical protein